MRNLHGLDEAQIDRAKLTWEFITQTGPEEGDATLESAALSGFSVNLDISQAATSGSTTAFLEGQAIVRLGADAYPSSTRGLSANANLSLTACLCHELAHAQRYHLGFRRPLDGCETNLDEAETSIHASYMPFLTPTERHDLIDDARERLEIWKREYQS